MDTATALGRRWDVVIVGGGTAGCVLAARLSADPARAVLLLEAGPAPRVLPPGLLDARVVPGARGVESWAYPAALAADRPYAMSRGRVLGGSSTTNGGYFIHATPEDLGAWAASAERIGPAADAARWAPPAARAAQLAIEDDLDLPASPEHGHDGPVPVSRIDPEDPAVAALRAAALALGLPADVDQNALPAPGAAGPTGDGFGATPSNRSGSTRWNAALAYLLPVLDRPNLAVLGGVEAARVLLEGDRAVGVETAAGRIDADAVVLAAGALRSPDLLRRSGVDLPGLGEGLDDHPQLVIEAADWPASASDAPTWLGGVVHATLPDGATVEVLQSLVPMTALTGGDGSGPAPFLVSTRGERGRLRAVDDGLPFVDFDHLATAATRARLRAAARLAADLVRAGGGRPVSPDPATEQDDAALDAWVAGHLGTALHTCGGAAMGEVVDAGGRVLGIDGLRVADTSILPSAPRRGPAATAFLIGELVAASMLEGR